MVSFVNFTRIASIGVGFQIGTLQGYFFCKDYWPNFNFPLEYQVKLVLIFKPGFHLILTQPWNHKIPYPFRLTHNLS